MRKRAVRHEVVQPLDTSYRYIPLTKGMNAIVDARDFEWLSQWDWYAWKSRHVWYALRNPTKEEIVNGKRIPIRMHRFILGASARVVDHHDGNGLNNRRINLRPCTLRENQENSRLRSNNKSGYKGVSRLRTGKYLYGWRAQITHQGKKIQLGTFQTEYQAAKAYDDAAFKLKGNFARLNFPISSHPWSSPMLATLTAVFAPPQ